MKISIEDDDKKLVMVKITDDSDTDTVLREFCGLMVAYGFHPESIKDTLKEFSEEELTF